MRLITWLKLAGMSVNVFAKKIGKDKSLVHKYLYEDVIPKHNIIKEIFLITNGAVTPNDFHQLSEEVFEQELEKRKKIEQDHGIDFKY